MNLYLKQKVFSIRDKFTVYDENEAPLYTVDGKIVSIHRKHSIFNNAGEEVANISKKIVSFLPKFFIERPVGQVHEMDGKMAFAHEVYVFPDLGWELKGKFMQHDYTITKDGQEVASIHQKWLSWGDTYEIAVSDGFDEVLVLAVIICVDVVHEEEEEASSGAVAAGIAAKSNN